MVMVLISAFASAQSTDPEPVAFILRVNGMEWFRFSSPIKSEICSWSLNGREGATLKFNVTLLDKFEDEMGFAILTIPTSAVKPGQVAMLSWIPEGFRRRPEPYP